MTRPNRLHSLTELMADLEAGRISSVEATEASLKATEDWQPKINAFIRVDGEQALAAAKAADDARANGDTRPLLGAPLANKDMFLRRAIALRAALQFSAISWAMMKQQSSRV